MNENKLNEVCKKGEVNIEGYVYEIDVRDEEVVLIPHGTGAEASSSLGWDAYEYTHGGATFKTAVDVAQEISEHLRKIRAKSSDI